jgi:ATP-binding cassette subfamily C (CFTR/MRP) protein 1
MIQARRATVQLTDKRVRLLQEILQGIRLLVLFVRVHGISVA